MSTTINITIGDNRLIEISKLKQTANRQTQLEKEADTRVEAQATDARTKAKAAQGQDTNGNILTGTGVKLTQIDRRPIANRNIISSAFSERGLFGFIDVNNAYANSLWADSTFSAENKIDITQPIIFNRQSTQKYGVIRVVVAGANDSCVADLAPPSYYFAGKENELLNFVRAGGVLWINSEYEFCGITASTFNSYLSSTFGISVNFVPDEQPEPPRIPISGIPYTVVRTNLVYNTMLNKAPIYFYVALTCSISNGTPFYSSLYGPVCAFEKVGKGFVVLSGDQNGTNAFPSITESSVNFINALRTLQ